MLRAVRLPVLLAVALAGAALAVPAPPAAPPRAALERLALDLAPVDDPFPIRRLRGSDRALPDLLAQLDGGPVARLARADFEARVRAAARAAAPRALARLTDATYSAELTAGGELAGTAELQFACEAGAGFVPLDPLKLAVRSAAWDDGTGAALAVPPGRAAPAVWSARAGRRALKLEWSLAGTAEPGQRRFELRVPPCPTAQLDLALPADRVPAPGGEVLLTGPFPVPGKPALRLWRVRFGGRAAVAFAVRASGPPAAPAHAKLSARYDLAPGQLSAAFEYDLRPARGTAGEWSFLVDPALRVTDVVTNNRAGWTVDPPEVPDGPRRVRVALRQPGPGGKVLVSAVAPFPDPRAPGAPLPVVRPERAVLEDENWDVRLAPDLRVEGWAPGDYRLADAPAAPEAARALALVGTFVGPGADAPFRRPPTVRAAAHEPEFATVERLEWDLAPDRAALVARVEVRVRRGPLFHLAVRPPPGFVLDRSAPGASELVGHVGAPANGAQALEFARPLLAGQRAELVLEFRGPGAAPGAAVPFPAFAVTGAAERAGWLSVAADPQWALATRAGPGATPGALWGWLCADPPPGARALFLYTGRAPDGTAALAPARPSLRADALVRAERSADGWTATTRFELTASGGAVPGLFVLVPGAPAARAWHLGDPANAVADAVPVPVPPALGGALWAVRFARPLAGGTVLETSARGPVVPVPRVLGAANAARAEAGRAGARVEGDRVVPVPRAPAAVAVTDPYLVTAVRAPGELEAAFGGTARADPGGALAVLLPPGATATAARAGDKWLLPAALAARDAGGAVRVPVPAGGAVRFEVRYRLPAPRGWPTRAFVSPAPRVAGAPAPKRWWAFAPGTLPGWPSRPWEQTADLPPLLCGAPLGEPPALVTRSDDEWVRAGAAATADALAAALAALVLAALFGAFGHPVRMVRGSVLLAAAVAAALAAVELGPPWWARAAWPPLVASTLALAVLLAVLGAHAVRAARAARAAPVAALLALAAGAGAQQPQPVTVLIVTAAHGGEEVVAPRALLDRLAALAVPAPPPVVVTGAEYAVRADDTGARVTARFAVFNPGAREGAVALPLAGARLERATADGKPALPELVRPDVYAVPVPPGAHAVEVRFAVAVTANGPDREVKFGAPDVPGARLTAELPGAARQPVAVGCAGAQRVTAGDRAALDADLGADPGAPKPVHLRWREGAGGAAVLRAREACAWEVREGGAELTCAYLARVEQGAAAGARFEVPAELEVLRVTARALDAADKPGAALPLRDWALAPEQGGVRALRVDFQAPVTGRFAVVFECAPRCPLARSAVLRFPRAVPAAADSVYAFRATGVLAELGEHPGLIAQPADALGEFAAVPDLNFESNPRPRAFKRAPGAAGELRVALRATAPPGVRTASTWHLGPARADASGSVAWSAAPPLALVEFAVPGARVLEVRGPDVRAWNQTGGRVQVWLRAAAREGSFEWYATADRNPAEPLTFDAPPPVVFGSKVVHDEVRARAADGFVVRPERARGWEPLPAPPGEFRARTEAPDAQPPRVLLVPR
jgi:hypothetical protein